MKTISFNRIRDAVVELCQRANFDLTADMRGSLQEAASRESGVLAKSTLLRIIQNADVAADKRVPMCQDTGLVVVFAKVGQEVHIVDGLLHEAINEGVRRGYSDGYLRASVVEDPLLRRNTKDNTPAVLHIELVAGDGLCLHLLAKGGGCENMSRFKMLTPAEGRDGIIQFVVETALLAGPNACPPIVVGVGIGGSFEHSAVLAKKSLLKAAGERNSLPLWAETELEILQKINESGIGPQGYGGDTTSLDVHIETAACHIASLPVSVNIECHAHRHQQITL